MESEIRQGEQESFNKWLRFDKHTLSKNSKQQSRRRRRISRRSQLFVGVSKRTSMESILELERNFPVTKLTPFPSMKNTYTWTVYLISSRQNKRLIFPKCTGQETMRCCDNIRTHRSDGRRTIYHGRKCFSIGR